MIKRFFTHGHPLAVSAVIALVAMLGYQIVPAFVGGNFLGQTGGGGQCADYGTFTRYIVPGSVLGLVPGPSGEFSFLQYDERMSGPPTRRRFSTAGSLGAAIPVSIGDFRYDALNSPDGNMWGLSGAQYQKLAPDGTTAVFNAPETLQAIKSDADGHLYLQSFSLTPQGWYTYTLYSVAPDGAKTALYTAPQHMLMGGVAGDAAGNTWTTLAPAAIYSGSRNGVVVKIGSSGISTWPLPTTERGLSIAIDAQDNAWVSAQANIFKVTPAGVITTYPIPWWHTPHTNTAAIDSIIRGTDGNMWALATEQVATTPTDRRGLYMELIKIAPDGTMSKYDVEPSPGFSFDPNHMPSFNVRPPIIGPDGNLWYSYRYSGYDDNNSYIVESAIVKVSLCGTAGGPSQPVTPQSGLLAHWTFDQGTINGSTVQDVSGNGHDLANNGATATNGCMLFGGSNSYLTTNLMTGLPSGNAPRSIAYWLNTAAYQDNASPLSLGNSTVTGVNDNSPQRFATGPGTSGNGNYGIFTDAVNAANGANNIQISGNGVPPVNTWHHITFTYDGAGHWAYYLDGSSAGTGTFGVGINTVSNALDIGAFRNYRHQSSADYFFKGQMDDVRIYDHALTAQDITQIAQIQPSCAGNSSSSAQVFLQCNNGAGTCNAIQSGGSCTTRQVTCPSGTVEAPGASAMACTNDGCTGSCVFCQPVQGSSSSRQVTSGGVCPPCRQACGMSGPVCLTCGAGTVPSCPAGSIGAPYCDLNNQPRCMFTQGGVTSATCGTANQASPLGCAQCMSAYCPGGDICTTGSSSSRAASSSSFRPGPGCGDGTKDAGEQCDDGNTVSGDGCSSQCKIEPGFRCIP